jgi:hypothetical protein
MVGEIASSETDGLVRVRYSLLSLDFVANRYISRMPNYNQFD